MCVDYCLHLSRTWVFILWTWNLKFEKYYWIQFVISILSTLQVSNLITHYNCLSISEALNIYDLIFSHCSPIQKRCEICKVFMLGLESFVCKMMKKLTCFLIGPVTSCLGGSMTDLRWITSPGGRSWSVWSHTFFVTSCAPFLPVSWRI